MAVQSIDELLARLDEIIAASHTAQSPRGYFAILYHRVTQKVKEAILAGDFDDNPRMERLDVAFGNRYLEAYELSNRGENPGRSWQLAFSATRRWRPIVIQHLLLGMNAHINVDLAVAAARVVPPGELPGFKSDFDRINGILGALVDRVEDDLAKIWPALGYLDHVGGRTDEKLISFVLLTARDHAWSATKRLSELTPEEQEREITDLDRLADRIGRRVLRPGFLISTVLRWVRLTERGSVSEKISLLE